MDVIAALLLFYEKEFVDLSFKSVYGILKWSGVRSKVDLAMESDLSFTLIPLWLGLVSLFNGISTFIGYLMLKPSIYKNSIGTI